MARLAALILIAVVAAAGITRAGIAAPCTSTVSVTADGNLPNGGICPACV
jgi:hypothetical protein